MASQKRLSSQKGKINNRNKMNHPGYCEPEWHLDERLFRQIDKFIGQLSGKCVDISSVNIKCEYLKKTNNIMIEQLEVKDLNFDILTGQYDNILLFETLEHLQNPLFCMLQLKRILNPSGNIFVMMPARPRFMWPHFHYFEIPAKHFNKWILKPLELKIVKQGKIYPSHTLPFYVQGFKQFMTLFFNANYIYQIQKC